MHEGLDGDRVGRWFRQHTGGVPPFEFAIIAGGRSNLSYRVADAEGGRWVLRRPPLHSVLASAHDIVREHHVLMALQDTKVPVPPVVALEEDDGVTGAPFYVMEFVDGLVPRDVEDVVTGLDEDARGLLGVNVADTLADLHAIDVGSVGLGDLARPTGYLQRQLQRWLGQYRKGSQRTLPSVEEVHDRLFKALPDEPETTIVHGDYRLDNLIVGEDGTVRAVLDWELCTLGDPLADVGLLEVYWRPQFGRVVPEFPTAGMAPGIPAVDEVVARYADRSGRDLSNLDFYIAFGYWKLAVIVEGVYARFSAGAYGDPEESELFGELALELLDRSEELSRRMSA